MSPQSTTPLPESSRLKEPAAGNYFVAAYPSFSCWTEDQAAAFEERLATPLTPGPLGLYVHIPFCEKRCDFCYYLSYDRRAEEVPRYLDALTRELELYASTEAFADRSFSFVYFGGGTPSVLSAARIRKLMNGLRARVPWAAEAEVSFECAPATVSAAKLDALAEMGVNRLSLGIQQLDDRVLSLNGRMHAVADVQAAWGAVHAAGFATVNVDLIAGMAGETDSSFHASLERVIDMGPDSVTVYLMEIPENTPLFRSWRDGEVPAELPEWETKRVRLEMAFERLEESGYRVRSAYTAGRTAAGRRFVYQDAQYRGADLLGIGASSFSYLGEIHHQNRAGLGAYLERATARRLPLWRAYGLNADERMVRETVLQLKLGRVDRGSMIDRFGVDVAERFAAPFERLARAGWLEIDEEAITLTRQGLLRADRLIRELYLPEHRVARYT